MGESFQSAADFVVLGEVLHAIQNPQVLHVDLYVSEVGKFFTLLERTRLQSTRREDVPLVVEIGC